METRPVQTPIVDHAEQTTLASQMAALNALAKLLGSPLYRNPGKHKRAGITKNKGQKRNLNRARMQRESRRRNRA